MSYEWDIRAKTFRDLWLSTWKLMYGYEPIDYAKMWKIKEDIEKELCNCYSLEDAVTNGYVGRNGTTVWLINRS